jgi:tetratricopeptide (TPR) repeat protein
MTKSLPVQPDGATLKIIDAAVDLQQRGEYEKSIDLLLQAQQSAPSYAPIQLLLGLGYRSIDREEEAEARFRRAIELDADQPAALQSLGLMLAEQKRSEEATEILSRHLALEPGDTLSLRVLANQLARMKKTDQGIALLEKAWEEVRSTEIGLLLGRYLMRARQPQKAEVVFRAVADSDKTSETLTEWAAVSLILRRYDDAVSASREATTLFPDSARAWGILSDALLGAEQAEEALFAAERALAVDDQECRYWLVKSSALLALERYSEALQVTQAGQQCVGGRGSSSRTAMHALVMNEVIALRGLERTDAALERLHQMRRDDPKSVDTIFALARLLNILDRPAESLAVLDEARAAGISDESRLAPLRYETLLRLNRSDDALSFITPFLAANREARLGVLNGIGIQFYLEEHVDLALRVFEHLLVIQPNYPRALLGIGYLQVGFGNEQEARSAFERALGVSQTDDLRAIALADLVYTALILGQYKEADDWAEQAFSLATQEGDALLRIAYWIDGRISPDPNQFPRLFRPVQLVLLANNVTTYLARGRTVAAVGITEDIIQKYPEQAVSYRIAGTVYAAIGDRDKAQAAWEQALERTKNAADLAAVKRWLASIA